MRPEKALLPMKGALPEKALLPVKGALPEKALLPERAVFPEESSLSGAGMIGKATGSFSLLCPFPGTSFMTAG